MVRTEKDMNLIIYIESAKSLLYLRDILQRTKEISEYHLFQLKAIVFGSDDFCASIGAERSNEGGEVMVARQKIVINAKAFDLQAIDMVYIDYKDIEGLKKQCVDGAKLGFTGKQCIHPGQVETIQQAFTPSRDKIEWATELIKLFEEHQKSGKGAFTFRGHMIDKPLLLQAQNLVDIASTLKH
jgi:citrate lyase subunit beta-like protein